MFARALRTRSAVRGLSFYRAYSAPATSVNQVPANDPVKRDPKQTVSETNAAATSSEGSFDKVLQESVAKAEQLRTKQAPNYEGTWSTSQQPRAVAMQGPRFEQTIMEEQVCGMLHLTGWTWRRFKIGILEGDTGTLWCRSREEQPTDQNTSLAHTLPSN